MKHKLAILAILAVAFVCLGAAPDKEAEPIQTHKIVMYSLQVTLPKEQAGTPKHAETYRKNALAFAKDLFGKLEKHFAETDGISPTQFSAGVMLRSLRYRDVIIHFAIDEKLGDDKIIAKLKSYPFETTVLLSKSTTTTETFEIRTP